MARSIKKGPYVEAPLRKRIEEMNRRFENLFEIDPLHEGMTRFVLCARRKNSSSPVVFLVNLAKGRLGEDSAALLGGLLVTTGEVRMRLSRGSARNAPILFWMGAMPSARYPNVKRSNSFSRKLRTVSFFKRPTMAFRKLRSVSS